MLLGDLLLSGCENIGIHHIATGYDDITENKRTSTLRCKPDNLWCWSVKHCQLDVKKYTSYHVIKSIMPLIVAIVIMALASPRASQSGKYSGGSGGNKVPPACADEVHSNKLTYVAS